MCLRIFSAMILDVIIYAFLVNYRHSVAQSGCCLLSVVSVSVASRQFVVGAVVIVSIHAPGVAAAGYVTTVYSIPGTSLGKTLVT